MLEEGGWWFARVDGVQGAVTQARRLDQIGGLLGVSFQRAQQLVQAGR